MNFIKYIIIALVSCFMFSSCEDCKTCEPDIDWIWDDGMSQAEIDATDATFQLLYGMNEHVNVCMDHGQHHGKRLLSAAEWQ